MKKLSLGVAVLVLAGCSNGNDVSTNTISNDPSSDNVASQPLLSINSGNNVASSPSTSNVAPEAPSNWSYSDSHDEMRGVDSHIASLVSDNQTNFDFPYSGGSNLSILLKRTSNDPTDIAFRISKGQFICDTFQGNCYASVKFDDQPIQTFRLEESSSHAPDILFISDQSDTDSFINSLLTAKKVIVELPFFQEGKRQFKFTLSGLKWVQPTPVKQNDQGLINGAAYDKAPPEPQEPEENIDPDVGDSPISDPIPVTDNMNSNQTSSDLVTTDEAKQIMN